MVIKDNRKDNTTDFDSLYTGECFEYGNHIYLKMDDIYAEGTVYNAVILDCGVVEEIDSDTIVTRLRNAEITIS